MQAVEATKALPLILLNHSNCSFLELCVSTLNLLYIYIYTYTVMDSLV